MLVSMVATINSANPVDPSLQEIRNQVRVLLRGDAGGGHATVSPGPTCSVSV
jgi:hypothetical protein